MEFSEELDKIVERRDKREARRLASKVKKDSKWAWKEFCKRLEIPLLKRRSLRAKTSAWEREWESRRGGLRLYPYRGMSFNLEGHRYEVAHTAGWLYTYVDDKQFGSPEALQLILRGENDDATVAA